MIRSEALTDCGIEEQRLRRNICVKGQLCSELGLDKCIGSEELIEGGEGFKCCRARSEAAGAVSARNEKPALQGQDGSAVQVGKHDALYAERGVAHSAIPDMILILKLDGNINFDLIGLSESLLVDDVTFVARRAICVDSG